jgi:hypothetical protein
MFGLYCAALNIQLSDLGPFKITDSAAAVAELLEIPPSH